MPPYAIIGAGNMGEAIATGLVRSNLCAAQSLLIAETDRDRRNALVASFPNIFSSADETIAALSHAESLPGSGPLILAVKPQVFPQIVPLLAPSLSRTPRLVISILAGVTTRTLAESFPGARIVRAMPNLPAKLSKGCSALCAGPRATPEDLLIARQVFESLGHVHDLPEELMDAFTAVAGSGPAYLFFLAEAMEQAAVAADIPTSLARAIVRQVIAGSAALLESDPRTPADLRAAVTSRGGTTAAAIDELTRAGVLAAFVRAILAARDRAHELSWQTP
jgi:pyrroline-5-carboxylate reductase